MKESSNTPESPAARMRRLEREYRKRYEAIPAARPVLFTYNTEEGKSESPFVFPPLNIEITKAVIEELADEGNYSESELSEIKYGKRLENLRADESVYGEYEVSCLMRGEGDVNRVDKMIAELDDDNPWQPGKLEHLLVLRHKHPELFDEPVLALGSQLKQTGAIACLEERGGRAVYNNYPRGAGNYKNRFLIYRKKSK